MKILIIKLLLLVGVFAYAQKPVEYAINMANSDIVRNPEGWMLDFSERPRWNYCHGLVCLAHEKLWSKTGDEKYYNYIKKYADDMINEDGTIKDYSPEKYNIDPVNNGKFVFALYERTKDQKYKKALDLMRSQMKTHPRTKEGGFWHKAVYPHQMWLDGLYMASPFLAQYAVVFDEPEIFDDLANQLLLIDKYTKNPKTGLYHHGWDESREQAWSDKETGRSPHVWGRGMGWYAMALVDVLEFFPKNHPKYKQLEKLAQSYAKTLIKYQDKKQGLWYQVMDVQGEGNYLESSASTMFIYFLIKGSNMGILDKNARKAAEVGYKATLDYFIKKQEDGGITITDACAGAGLGGKPYRSGTFEYYINEAKRDNDPKSVGPFIMLALEFEKK